MQKYLEIYEKIKDDIVSGALRFNDKLPSKRDTAEKFSVSVITVEHAYELLISEGYVESKERSGYFVSYRKGEFFVAEKFIVPEKAPFTQNADEGLSFDKLAKTVRSVLSDYGEELLLRSENKGAPILRKAIKNYLKRNKGINVDERRIIVGSGAEYLYGLIIELLGPNKTYALETPTYEQIEKVYACKKVKTLPLEIGVNGIPSETLKNADADALHITPFKNYPTGVYADVNKKAEYLKWAKDNDAFIIEDDYDSEFSRTGRISETVFSMDKNDCVIYVNTFSKTIAHSLRVGYMILPDKLVEDFDKRLGFYTCTVPTLEQFVIARILSDGTFEKHINKIRRQRKLSSQK
ncbi:MAG: PLP-dependent aminotransferase family protein [Clostridia bacterium]|nr:PLP-dependent aminotransferase family protein [Clostridia bacterium]